jgi:hypothetical protein
MTSGGSRSTVRLDRSLRYVLKFLDAAMATASQLLVLVLLVRQMESTRTPSTLAKVSLWTIAMMFIADSWIFSAHAVIGIMSDNRTSMPMLVPAFLFLCSAVVFGPVSETTATKLSVAICGTATSHTSAGEGHLPQPAKTQSTSGFGGRVTFSPGDDTTRGALSTPGRTSAEPRARVPHPQM